jgi:hypothetical protein
MAQSIVEGIQAECNVSVGGVVCDRYPDWIECKIAIIDHIRDHRWADINLPCGSVHAILRLSRGSNYLHSEAFKDCIMDDKVRLSEPSLLA